MQHPDGPDDFWWPEGAVPLAEALAETYAHQDQLHFSHHHVTDDLGAAASALDMGPGPSSLQQAVQQHAPQQQAEAGPQTALPIPLLDLHQVMVP